MKERFVNINTNINKNTNNRIKITKITTIIKGIRYLLKNKNDHLL